MAKKQTEITTEIVDQTTGEMVIQTTKKTHSYRITSDQFYMSFLESTDIIKFLNPTQIVIMSQLCVKAQYNTGVVLLPKAIKQEIAELIKCSIRTINNAISLFKKNNLIDGSNGMYNINPKYFWKGTLNTRENLLKDNNFIMNITYSID